jgi:Predicted membrane protein
MQEPVVAFDLGRMFFGDVPLLFLLEIAFRTVVIYAYTMVLIRWVGGRSIAQLSLVEFLLVIALGSAVGDAMFYPDVPLVHCILVITLVVLLDKALSYCLARYPRLEDAIEGRSVEVVRDGVIDCARLKRMDVGHDELFEQLRLKGIEHLGRVRAAYFETNGVVSVFEAPEGAEQPGLSIEPPWDVRQPHRHDHGTIATGTFACETCGTLVRLRNSALPRCPNCKGRHWHRAADAEPRQGRKVGAGS